MEAATKQCVLNSPLSPFYLAAGDPIVEYRAPMIWKKGKP